MGLRLTDVDREPVNLMPGAESVTLENAGPRALRFVVGEAAGERAPTDLAAGHLLLPGRRTVIRLGGSAFPLWAWAEKPTTASVGA